MFQPRIIIMEMTNSASAKLIHEAFVSGHHGSSALDIILIVFPVVPGSILASSFTCRRQPDILCFFIEFVLCILPLILSFTVLSEVIHEFNAALILLVAVRMTASTTLSDSSSPIYSNYEGKKMHLSCLTSMRATVSIATIIAILAVDFPVFPRRFAKTETTGLSLMDVGAASYLFMNGITDLQKLKVPTQSLRDVLTLFFLGLLRLLSLKAVNYQEHVTEYGVHGNFFFTLAFVKILYLYVFSAAGTRARIILALVLAVGHQMALTFSLEEWTLSTEVSRDGLLAANREWIVSLPGNALIYLVGMVVGDFIFAHYKKEPKLIAWVKFLPLLSFSVLFILTTFLKIEPSRRLNNLSFSAWIIGFFLLFMNVFDAMETLFKQTSCHLLQAVNRYSLLFFLSGNLLTGFINLNINTLQVGNLPAFIIITFYVLILCSFVFVLNSKNVPKNVGS